MARVVTESYAVERAGAILPLRLYRSLSAGGGALGGGLDGGIGQRDGAGAPLLVYFHGGAFAFNNTDVYDSFYRALAALEGLNVLAVDYRLAPEHRFPVGLQDAFAALTWADEHAEALQVGAHGLAVGGDSSGGNFAAAACLMARDRGGPALAAQVLIYPLTVFRPDVPVPSEQRYGRGYFLEYTSGAGSVDFYFNDIEQADDPLASPLGAPSLAGLPPALVVSAECDPLLDQALWYAARLEDEAVAVEYDLVRGMIHGFINRPYRQTFEALNRIGRFLRRVAR
jgi:acetyl esterase